MTTVSAQPSEMHKIIAVTSGPHGNMSVTTPNFSSTGEYRSTHTYAEAMQINHPKHSFGISHLDCSIPCPPLVQPRPSARPVLLWEQHAISWCSRWVTEVRVGNFPLPGCRQARTAAQQCPCQPCSGPHTSFLTHPTPLITQQSILGSAC